jgi:hypothetical protein
MKSHCWKLSPSDFAFLWEECKRCFYLKVVTGFLQPRPPMPKIFNLIDAKMKSCYANKRKQSIVPNLPPGVVEYGENWVESQAILLPNETATCFIRGRLDTVMKFDDGTYGVIDFKTSTRKAEHVSLYARQLHAYCYALEHPAPGNLGLSPVSRLGLLVFEPSSYVHSHGQEASLSGGLSWVEIPRDDQGFLDYLAEVLAVLEQPQAPGGSPSCEWCQYRDASRRTGL